MTVIRTAELLFSTPYLSANGLAAALQVTAPTARAAIEYLVQRGDLVEATGRRRNRFYFAPANFEAVYGTSTSPEEDPGLFPT